MIHLRSLLIVLGCFAVFACQDASSAPSTAEKVDSDRTQQEQDGTPRVVVEAFAAKYPNAKDVDWRRDRNDSYEAHFELGDRKLRADFNPNGTWIETEESIDYDELPKAVQEAIKAEFDKDDIVELEFTDNAEKGEFYDVEIDPKGEKKFDVEYRADGTKL